MTMLASVTARGALAPIAQHQLACHQYTRACIPRPLQRSRTSTTASAASITTTPSPTVSTTETPATTFKFACPICLQEEFVVDKLPARAGGLPCRCCNRTFKVDPTYVDLTLTSGIQAKVYDQRGWVGQELFRQPLISFVYERGWRQGFSWAGFPGVDKEFDMAMKYMKEAEGKALVDMSCGSGLFTRLFARSGKFSSVVAADFSESMLRQTDAFLKEEQRTKPGSSTQSPVMLLRCDVGRLPFRSGSVAALHAGAAMHCWPNPQAALAEISRVLQPGGVFVASTFMVATAPLGQMLGDDLVRPLNQLAPPPSSYRWWEEQEIRDLCDSVGLQDYTSTRTNRFIMFKAVKPGKAE